MAGQVPAYVELQSTYERPTFRGRPARVPGTRKAPRVRPDAVDPGSVPAGYRLADGSFQSPLFGEAG